MKAGLTAGHRSALFLYSALVHRFSGVASMQIPWQRFNAIIQALIGRGCGKFALGVITLGVSSILTGPWWTPLMFAIAEHFWGANSVFAFTTPSWVSLPLGLGLIAAGFLVFYFCPHNTPPPREEPEDPRPFRFVIGANAQFEPFAQQLCRMEKLRLDMHKFTAEERGARLRDGEERHHATLEDALLELGELTLDVKMRAYRVERQIQKIIMEVKA